MLESRALRGTLRSLDTSLRALNNHLHFITVIMSFHTAKEDYKSKKKVADLDWPRTDSTCVCKRMSKIA